MNDYSTTDITTVRNFVAAFTGERSESSILAGWSFVADLIAEHGKDGAIPMVNAMLDADLSPNKMTRVLHAARLIALVNDVTDPKGAQAVASEFTYMAAGAKESGKGRSVAATVNAMVKDGTRFATVAAMADAMKADRKAALAEDKAEGTDPKVGTEATLDSALIAILKRIDRTAEDFGTDVFTILSTLADMAEAALDATAVADEAADAAALAA